MWNEIKDPLMGLSIWLAILALLVTLHADVFEQELHPALALFVKPFTRFSSPKPISLTSLLTPDSNSDDDSKPPIYIFALDVSKSLLEQKIAAVEVQEYRKTFSHEEIEIYRPYLENIRTAFDIAQVELCRYIRSVPEDSRVALWTFGNQPQLRYPEENDNQPKYITLKKNTRGGNPRNAILSHISNWKANEEFSNFEELFRVIHWRYREEIKNIRTSDIHLVIISDFAHDIGGGKYFEDIVGHTHTTEAQIWRSRYRVSEARIADYFRDLSREGVTFHLAVVMGALRKILAVHPIAGEALEVYSYRETYLLPHQVEDGFDFLRAYEKKDEGMKFFFTLGQVEPSPRQILIDDQKYENTDIRFSLASEATLTTHIPLKIRATLPSQGSVDKGVIRIGEGFKGKIERQGDVITLQTFSILDPQEASTYRLLISWHGRNDEDVSVSKTFAIPITFYKRLSWYGALSIILAEFALVVFSGWTIWVLVINRDLC